MDFFRNTVNDHVHSVLASFPDRISHINEFSTKNFDKTITEAEAAFLTVAKSYAGKSNIAANDKLATIVSTTKEVIGDAIIALSALQRWIIVNTPRIEDGGNFGVAVQEIVAKGLSETIKDLTTKLNEVSDYHSKRAEVVKAVASETSTSESKSSSKGTDKGESKDSTSEEKKESTSSKNYHEDSLRAIASVDTKYYFASQVALQAVADAYLLAGFAAERNQERLERPRGKEGSKNPLSMY